MVLPEPTQFLAPGDPGFESTSKMLARCLDVIAPNTNRSRTMQYFCEWLLFGCGHPAQREAPIEPFASGKNVPQTLAATFNLSGLLRYPADYFGHLLTQDSYGQTSSNRFYPTLQPVADMMADLAATSAIAHGNAAPFHAFDPCLGTGRLSLALSNHCRSLFGWERDAFLIKVATANFMLYAPDFALPIPGLGGDLVRGDTLTGEGRSLVRGYEYRSSLMHPIPVPTLQPIVPTTSSKKEEEPSDQLCLF